MCLPSVIVAGLSLFTYTWLLLLPVLGIIFGIHTFCTISLVVVSALLISHLIPGIVRWIFPIIDLAVLSVAVIIPLALIPEWVTDLYLLLFAFLEPVLLVVEVIQVVSAIRSTGLFAQQGISEQPTFWKGTVLFSTLISWVFSVSILLCNPEFGNLLFLLCLLNIFAHAITVWADEGIISDSALVLLASSCYLWLGSLEQDISAVVCSSFGQRPEGEADAATLLGGILSLPYISLAAPLATVTSLREVTRPSFWLGIALRVLSAFFVTKQLFLRRKAACRRTTSQRCLVRYFDPD
ncbi:uncharacterized protein LOC135370352 isoform X2 [Ornithodoros turicata]|uniref:uncharacterized protein LOC135370352 isoform X2 n=1 Tax=Ornithodoros turicata TaxID=34597 RepID=UPI003139F61F